MSMENSSEDKFLRTACFGSKYESNNKIRTEFNSPHQNNKESNHPRLKGFPSDFFSIPNKKRVSRKFSQLPSARQRPAERAKSHCKRKIESEIDKVPTLPLVNVTRGQSRHRRNSKSEVKSYIINESIIAKGQQHIDQEHLKNLCFPHIRRGHNGITGRTYRMRINDDGSTIMYLKSHSE